MVILGITLMAIGSAIITGCLFAICAIRWLRKAEDNTENDIWMGDGPWNSNSL